jgi:hypothetical protein
VAGVSAVASRREPPYPPSIMAKGWRFELDHERLIERSATWSLAPPEARPWLLMLWMTAWRQQPAGSLEADEQVVAARIGMPDKLWQRHRALMLRNWWVATDGRMYHDFIAALVLEMMAKRRSAADRQAAQRARSREFDEEPMNGEALTSKSRVTHGAVQAEFGRSSAPTTDHLLPTTKGEVVAGEEKEINPLPPLQGGSSLVAPPAMPSACAAAASPPPKQRKRRAARSPLLLGVDAVAADGVDPQHAAEWLAIRADKNLPLTQTAWDDVKLEARKAQLTPAAAVEKAVKRSWAGFRASWVLNEVLDAPNASRRSGPPPLPSAADTEARNDEARRLLGFKTRGRPAAASADPVQPTRSAPPLLIAATNESPS